MLVRRNAASEVVPLRAKRSWMKCSERRSFVTRSGGEVVGDHRRGSVGAAPRLPGRRRDQRQFPPAKNSAHHPPPSCGDSRNATEPGNRLGPRLRDAGFTDANHLPISAA